MDKTITTLTISDDDFEAANRRAAERRAAGPVAVEALYDQRLGKVVVQLSSGLGIMFSPQDAQGLEDARPEDLEEIEISPSGQGLHFPAVDADVYLPGLLEGYLGSHRWLAERNGRKGGQQSTLAKAAAARENGKRGGRPRKLAG